ncbi:MAG: hypothetical protein ACPGEG_00775 [Salibacteraceae bacterium]
MRQHFFILATVLYFFIPSSVLAQKEVTALQVDYRIEIESGRDPKRPEVRQSPIVFYNRMYIYNERAVYVSLDSSKTWKDYQQNEKSIFWRKGKTSYKYEYKDTNCCIMYSSMKNRYRYESTVVVEKIIGRNTKKVMVYDDVNNKNYLVWADHSIGAAISPIGFMNVGGLVMRLRNENVVYEVRAISKISVDESFFDIDTEKYKFSEKAFRKGIIE